MNPAPAPSTAVYVYCVVRAHAFEDGEGTLQAEAIGGSGEPVRLVRHGDLAAVVSDSPNIRYTLRREYLDAHQRVLSEALARADILPVSFGSLARDDRQVQEILLHRQRDELHRYLEYVHDRVELDVRVYWVQERLFEEIVAENATIRELRDYLADADPDAAYYQRIQLGEMTEAAMGEKRQGEADRIVALLEQLAVDTRVNPEQADTMVLNAAFLVDRPRQQEFHDCVRQLADREAGRLIVQYVGPVAPYNFVTVHVAWQE